MDVNFTSSSGTQTPLANIVESGDRYVCFENGLQIEYSESLNTEVVKATNGTTISGLILYEKPFINRPVITAGINNHGTLIEKVHNPGVGNVMIPFIHDINMVSDENFEFNGIKHTDHEGFLVEILLNESEFQKVISSTFFVSYIAIGRWK